MAKKLQNKHLLLIFIGLLLIVGGVQYWQSSKDPDTFESQIVKVDSAAIDKFQIRPEFDKSQEVLIEKRDKGNWQVKDSAGWKPVDETRLRRTFDQLQNFQASHLASKSQKDWGKYEVDSSGTLVRIFQDGNLHSELVLGKMKFQNQQMAINYVRKLNESSVYAVEGYLQASLKGDKKSWIKGEGGSSPGRRRMMQQRLRQKMGQ